MKQGAEGEQVRPVVGFLPEQLFGRGVSHPRAPDHLYAGGLTIGGLEFREFAAAAAFRKTGG